MIIAYVGVLVFVEKKYIEKFLKNIVSCIFFYMEYFKKIVLVAVPDSHDPKTPH